MAEIRSKSIQTDTMRFRRNIERIGEVLCYEMSKSFDFTERHITTPLGTKSLQHCSNQVVLCSILRAGLPLHNGISNYFDCAENAFISAFRKHLNETDFEIVVEYLAAPSLEGKTLVLADPMLATGRSLVATYEALLKNGTPKEIHVIAVIGAKEGVAYVNENFPKNAHLWIADIDDDLNDKGYIIPGLGDAGDLAFGEKL